MVNRPGFTRIELLVVVGIVTMLVGVCAVGVQKVRIAAKRMADT